MMAPKLESAGFGWLVADGKRYTKDLFITVDGQILLRPKHLSIKYGGWHTVLGPEELEYALVGHPEILLVGCGHYGVLPIIQETYALAAKKGVQIEQVKIPKALIRYKELAQTDKRVATVLHLTC